MISLSPFRCTECQVDMVTDSPNLSKDDESLFAEWQKRVEGTNVSETTLLATDYLNHFNEIIMLIDLLPTMPGMWEECGNWKPKGYREHFRDSAFSDGELALEAYEHVPDRHRVPFEDAIERINASIAMFLEQLGAAIQLNDSVLLSHRAACASLALQRMLEIVAAIIHGSEKTLTQDEIDRLIEASVPSECPLDPRLLFPSQEVA